MLEGAPDAIYASAYGLGSDRVRENPQSATCQRERGVRATSIDNDGTMQAVPGDR